MISEEDRERSLDSNMADVMRDKSTRNVIRKIVMDSCGMDVFTPNPETSPLHEGIRTLQLDVMAWAQRAAPGHFIEMLNEHFIERGERDV